MDYIHVTGSAILPGLSALRPFKAIVVIEQPVTAGQRATICEWLVESGCLYVMAWGDHCEDWANAVGVANLKAFNYGDIPDDRLTISTTHERDDLDDVFWFAKNTAMHPCAKLDQTVLIHLAPAAREQQLLDQYHGA